MAEVFVRELIFPGGGTVANGDATGAGTGEGIRPMRIDQIKS